jgi:hypothetical protein
MYAKVLQTKQYDGLTFFAHICMFSLDRAMQAWVAGSVCTHRLGRCICMCQVS